MKLRTRFVVVMAGFVFALTCLASLIAARVFLSRASSLERELMRNAFEQGRIGLEKERDSLSGLADDWASWDDAYAFLSDTNQAFLDSNLVDGTFRTLDLNLIAFFDPQGRPFYAKGFDLEADRETPPPEHLWNRLLGSERLTRHTETTNAVAGFLTVHGDVWLVASRPILTSKDEGPAKGALIMARRISGNTADQDSLWGKIAVYPCENRVPGEEIVMRYTQLRTAKCNGWLPDLDGQRTVMIECSIERTVFMHGLISQFYLTGWILLCGAGTGLFAFWVVDRWILRELAQSLENLQTGIHALAAESPPPSTLKTSRRDEMGALANSLYGMLESLSNSQRSLRVSEEKYRTLAESAPDAIVQLDRDGRILAGNRAFFRDIVKVAESHAVGQPLVRLWPGALAAEIQNRATRIESGKPMTIDPLPNVPNEPEKWFSASLGQIGGTANNEPSTLVMVRDVTESVRIQQMADNRRMELIQAQKLTAMGTLVAGVAHEVNNPNTVISLNLAALQRRINDLLAPPGSAAGGTPPVRQEIDALVSEMRDASTRIAALVASLKTFTRPPSPTLVEPVSLNTVIRKAGDLLRHVIAKKQCVLSLALSDNLPLIEGNSQQLTQVMVNLIQNAAEASIRPDAMIEVTSAWDRAAERIRVTVRDQGMGIAPENIERIFEPFFTTRREQGGTGLGLPISAEIVRAHRGRIDVRSEPGQGALFTIELPTQERGGHGS